MFWVLNELKNNKNREKTKSVLAVYLDYPSFEYQKMIDTEKKCLFGLLGSSSKQIVLKLKKPFEQTILKQTMCMYISRDIRIPNK